MYPIRYMSKLENIKVSTFEKNRSRKFVTDENGEWPSLSSIATAGLKKINDEIEAEAQKK